MTPKEMDDEIKRQVAEQMRLMDSTATQIAVTQAVVTALVGTHPDPALLRQRAESLLAQAQVELAVSGKTDPVDGQFPRLLPDAMKTALDYLFRPVKYVDPE